MSGKWQIAIRFVIVELFITPAAAQNKQKKMTLIIHIASAISHLSDDHVQRRLLMCDLVQYYIKQIFKFSALHSCLYISVKGIFSKSAVMSRVNIVSKICW